MHFGRKSKGKKENKTEIVYLSKMFWYNRKIKRNMTKYAFNFIKIQKILIKAKLPEGKKNEPNYREL